jgi:hypothetical protein
MAVARMSNLSVTVLLVILIIEGFLAALSAATTVLLPARDENGRNKF